MLNDHSNGSLTGFTQDLAELICSQSTGIPQAAFKLAKEHVLDTFAVAIAGLNSETAMMMLAHATRQGRSPEATIIGTNLRSSVETAALVNATLSHIHDYGDDCVVTITHPSAVLVPSLFALAEVSGATARRMLEAYIIAVDVIRRVSDVLGIGHFEKGWHPTATLGVLGAAGGCCYLLGLDAKQTANALGIAGSLAGGFIANSGTMTKSLHVGHAAQSGVMAARLAADGFTGNRQMLEHQSGFLKLFGRRDFNAPNTWKKFGDPYHVIDPGLNFKLHPCCAGLHPTINSTLCLVRQHGIRPDEVEHAQIIVEQMLIDILDNQDPQNGNEAKFSLQFALAACLCRAQAGLREFLSETVEDTQIRNLMKRCRLVAKKEPPSGSYPVDARVKVFLKDGTVYEHTTKAPPEHAMKNPLKKQELAVKFKECYEFTWCQGETPPLFPVVLHSFESADDLKNVTRFLIPSPDSIDPSNFVQRGCP